MRAFAFHAVALSQAEKGEDMDGTVLAGLDAALAFIERGTRKGSGGGRVRRGEEENAKAKKGPPLWVGEPNGGHMVDGDHNGMQGRETTKDLGSPPDVDPVYGPSDTVHLVAGSYASARTVGFPKEAAERVLSLLATPLFHLQNRFSSTQQERMFLTQCVLRIRQPIAVASRSFPTASDSCWMPTPPQHMVEEGLSDGRASEDVSLSLQRGEAEAKGRRECVSPVNETSPAVEGLSISPPKEGETWWQRWRTAGWIAPCDAVEVPLGGRSCGEAMNGWERGAASFLEKKAVVPSAMAPRGKEVPLASSAAPPVVFHPAFPSPHLPPPSTAALEAILANCFLTAVYCPDRFQWGGGGAYAKETQNEKNAVVPLQEESSPWSRRRAFLSTSSSSSSSSSSALPSASGVLPLAGKDPLAMLWPTVESHRGGDGGRCRPSSVSASPWIVSEEVFTFLPSRGATAGVPSVPLSPFSSSPSPCVHVGGAVFQPSTFTTYVTLFSVAFQQSIHRCGASFAKGTGGVMGSMNTQMGASTLAQRHGPRLVVYGNAHTMTPTAIQAARFVGYTHIRLLPAVSHALSGNIGLTLDTFQETVAEDLALGRVPSVLCCSVLQGPAAVVDAVGALATFCADVGIWCHMVMSGETDTNEGESSGDGMQQHRKTSISTKGSGVACLSLLRYMKEVEMVEGKWHPGRSASSSSFAFRPPPKGEKFISSPPSPTCSPVSGASFSSASPLPRLFQLPYQLAMQECREGMHYADSFHWSLVEGEDEMKDEGWGEDVWKSHVDDAPREGSSSSSFSSSRQRFLSRESGPAFCRPQSSRVSLVHQVLSDTAAPLLALPHDLTLLAMADVRKLFTTAQVCGWGHTTASFSSSSLPHFFSFCSLPSFPPASLVRSSSAPFASIPPTGGVFHSHVPVTRSHHGAVTPALLHAMGVALLLRCAVDTPEMRRCTRTDKEEEDGSCHSEKRESILSAPLREGDDEARAAGKVLPMAALHESAIREASPREPPQPRTHDKIECGVHRFSFHWCDVVTALYEHVVAEGTLEVRRQSVLGGRLVFRWRTLADECNTALAEAICHTFHPSHPPPSLASSFGMSMPPSTAALSSLGTQQHTTSTTMNAQKTNAYVEGAAVWERWMEDISLYCSVVTIERRRWVSLRWGGWTEGWPSSFFSLAYHKVGDEPMQRKEKQTEEEVGEDLCTHRGPSPSRASLGEHGCRSPVRSSLENTAFASAAVPCPTCFTEDFVRRKCVDEIWKKIKMAINSFL